MADRCSVRGCRGEADLVYLDHGICVRCWNQWTADEQPADALARALGIQVAETTETENAMPDTTPAAESAATEENPVPTKKSAKQKNEPKSKKKGSKVTTAAKPKREKKPKEDLCVFALRLTENEREKFHEVTGPAGGTYFARQLMVVFSNEDESGFRALLKEAKELRK